MEKIGFEVENLYGNTFGGNFELLTSKPSVVRRHGWENLIFVRRRTTKSAEMGAGSIAKMMIR